MTIVEAVQAIAVLNTVLFYPMAVFAFRTSNRLTAIETRLSLICEKECNYAN